jgi:hypothetical protein
MSILRLLFGISLLTLGRKLYWIFVGVIGFETGARLAAQFLHGAPELVTLGVALLVGVLGAVVAIFLRNLAIGFTGFLAGGYFLAFLTEVLLLGLVAFLIGGIIGAALLYALFDYALIGLSSVAGTTMIAQMLALGPMLSIVVALVLFVLGVVIQVAIMQSEKA